MSSTRRWILAGVVALLIAFGAAALLGGDGDFGGGRWDDGEHVERIVNADGTETFVVRDGDGEWDGGFPFGILFVPLVIFGFVALFRGVFGGRGPRDGGPGGWGYPPPWAYGNYAGGGPGGAYAGSAQGPAAPPWFEEWHRRAHDDRPAPQPGLSQPSVSQPGPSEPGAVRPAGDQPAPPAPPAGGQQG